MKDRLHDLGSIEALGLALVHMVLEIYIGLGPWSYAYIDI